MIRKLWTWFRIKCGSRSAIWELWEQETAVYDALSRPWKEYQERLRTHPHRNWRAADYRRAARIAEMNVVPLHAMNRKLTEEAWDEAYNDKLGFPPPASYER